MAPISLSGMLWAPLRAVQPGARLRADQHHRERCVLPACAPTWGQLSQEGHAQPRLLVESVSPGYRVHQQNCWVTRLNPEKWQERPHNLSAFGRTCWSPPPPGSLSQAGGPSQSPSLRVHTEGPHHGSRPMITGGHPAADSRASRAGLPTGVWDSSDPHHPLCLLWSVFTSFSQFTVTLSASGFALLIRPEINSKSNSSRLALSVSFLGCKSHMRSNTFGFYSFILLTK